MEEDNIAMVVDITDEAISDDEAIEEAIENETENKEYRCETCLKVLKSKNSLDFIRYQFLLRVSLSIHTV